MNRLWMFRVSLAAALVAAVFSGPVIAEPVGLETLNGGPPAADESQHRVIRIDSSTRWVNAQQNEIVRFVVRGGSGPERTFDWQFPANQFAVDLSKIVPAGTVGRGVLVYLSPDPTTQSD